MKITFYLKNISIPDGVFSYSVELGGFMRDNGWDIEFLIDDPSCKADSVDGIPVYSLSSKLDMLRFRRLIKYIKSKKPDMLISNIPARNPIIAPLKFLHIEKKPKLVAFFHLPPKRWNFFKSLVLSKFDGIVAVSENVLESLKRFTGRDDIVLLRNPFNFNLIYELAEQKLPPYLEDLFRTRRIVLYAGRFEDQKGVEDLIDIFYIVKRKVKNVILVLVGSGSKEGLLKKKIKSIGIEKDVIFIKPERNIFRYMKRADVFAFPSYYESLGRVVLESLFLGTPVVAYASDGDHVNILSQFNLVVPLGDIEGFAERIVDILYKEVSFNFKNIDYSKYDAKEIAENFMIYCNHLLEGVEEISAY